MIAIEAPQAHETSPVVTHSVTGGHAVDIVDSGGTRWVLDPDGLRFARLAVDGSEGLSLFSLEWTPCRRIDRDPWDGAWVITLDEDGLHSLRFGGTAPTLHPAS